MPHNEAEDHYNQQFGKSDESSNRKLAFNHF